MTDTLTNYKKEEPKPNRPQNRTMTVVWGIMLALLAGNVYAVWRTADAQSKMQSQDEKIRTQLDRLQDKAQDLTVRADTHEVMLRSELKQSREAADSAAGKAARSAERKAQELVNKMSSEYRLNQTEVVDAIGVVGRTAESNAVELATVRQGVDDVRSSVAEAKSTLESTRETLNSVRGDLGVQSGLIATNARQLGELRKRGEREYYEFSVPRHDRPFKVADVAIMVRKTKPKKGQFTIDVIADDKRMEKKNRLVNEPIQFYVAGERTPYEIVVNEVKEDRIVGYLAVPKVLRAAAR